MVHATCLIVIHSTSHSIHRQGGAEYWEAMRGFMAQAAEQTSLHSTSKNWSDGDYQIQTDSSANSLLASSSIPIMPSNILNIAQESLRSTSHTNVMEMPDKKEL